MKKNNRNIFIVYYSLIFVLIFDLSVLSDGLSGEYYSTQRWRDLYSNRSPLSNPAYLTERNYTSFRTALAQTLSSTFFLVETGVTLPIGLYQSVGVSYSGLTSDGTLQQTQFTPNGEIEVLDEIRSSHGLFMFSYAINPFGRVSFGTNVNIQYDKNYDDPVGGIGIDLGVSYRFLRHPIYGDNVIGLSFQNIMFQNSTVGSLQSNAVNLKLSWFGKFWESKIDAGIDFDIKDIGALAHKDGSAKQLEYEFNSRVGGWIYGIGTLYLQMGSEYWGTSIGVNVPTLNGGRDLEVAYQFLGLYESSISKSHTLYISADLGNHREEKFARKMAENVSLRPSELYNTAMRLYSQKKYWEAFLVFAEIIRDFPAFHLNDKVKLHLGLCNEHLRMFTTAEKHYTELIKQYPKSDARHLAQLGLANVNYKQNDFPRLEHHCTVLQKSSASDSLKDHGDYLYGQALMKKNRATRSLRFFKRIAPEHPEYILAQHTMGIAYFIKKEPKKAISILEKIAYSDTYSKTEYNIVNRTRLLLGFYYYDLGGVTNLDKAIEFLKSVEKESIFYEDAQLGLSWLYAKEKNWPNVLLHAEELETSSKRPIMHCEAKLLEVFPLMEKQEFDKAQDKLEDLLEIFEKISLPSPEELAAKAEAYNKTKKGYEQTAEEFNEIAFSPQSHTTNRKISRLSDRQESELILIQNFLKEQSAFKRNKFFERSIDLVKADVDYYLAVIAKKETKESVIEIQEEMAKEEKKVFSDVEDIDAELKKLEKQILEEQQKEIELKHKEELRKADLERERLRKEEIERNKKEEALRQKYKEEEELIIQQLKQEELEKDSLNNVIVEPVEPEKTDTIDAESLELERQLRELEEKKAQLEAKRKELESRKKIKQEENKISPLPDSSSIDETSNDSNTNDNSNTYDDSDNNTFIEEQPVTKPEEPIDPQSLINEIKESSLLVDSTNSSNSNDNSNRYDFLDSSSEDSTINRDTITIPSSDEEDTKKKQSESSLFDFEESDN